MELAIVVVVVLVIVFAVVGALVRAVTPRPEPAKPAAVRGIGSEFTSHTGSEPRDQPSFDTVVSRSHDVGLTVTVSVGRPPATRPSTVDSARWVPCGDPVVVAGYRIGGGLLFVGESLRALNGYGVEPALIDPRLPVDRDDSNRAGINMPYWPSYSSITPNDRSAYLEWLTGGRVDPDAYIGYVFLFFYGLERRALAGPQPWENPSPDLPVILEEVERLLGIYGTRSRSFTRYAGGFLSLFAAASYRAARRYEGPPPVGLAAGEIPLLLKLGLGQAATDQRPLPADWALAWIEATTSLRTPARRCSAEFQALFRIRYAAAFGAGVQLKPNQTKLTCTYQPASASFGGQFTVRLDVPDVTTQSRPLGKLVALAEGCCDDLDSYSRRIGRQEGTATGLAAVALLPEEIAASHACDEVDHLCRSLDTAIGTGDHAVVDAGPLLEAWPSFNGDKLVKADAVLLAQALERRGYGLEPDVRFGGRPLAASGRVVVFRSTAGTTAVTRTYEAGALLVHMGTALAASDGSVDDVESRHVLDHVQSALRLTAAERRRLAAHFAYLRLDPPGQAGVKQRIAALTSAQRQDLARFLVVLAAADGRVERAEVVALTKMYELLGLDPEAAYRDVHALSQPEDDEPVPVRPASSSPEFAIPARPDPGTIVLDPRRVAHTLAKTADVARVLNEIFEGDDPPASPEPGPPPPGTPSDTRSRETALLRALGERAEWSRVEAEQLAERLDLMLDGTLERLNEAALDRFGAHVCEGDDPILVNTTVVKEMLA